MTSLKKQKEILKNIIEESRAGKIAWFLDFDKTIVKPEPGKHTGFDPDYELQDMLIGLQKQNGGAVAPVTGRPYIFIKTLLPDIKVYSATEHGAIIHCKKKDAELIAQKVPNIAAIQEMIINEISDIEGAQLEAHKTATLTVEFTKANDPEKLGQKLERRIKGYLASNPDYKDVRVFNGSVPGIYYIEILHQNVDKGAAIEEIMGRPEFEGKTPLYAGDSEADRSGMSKVQEFNGYAIGVTECAPDIKDVHLKSYKDTRRLISNILSDKPAHKIVQQMIPTISS